MNRPSTISLDPEFKMMVLNYDLSFTVQEASQSFELKSDIVKI
ncbi:hypothetical protein ACFPIA_01000 [Pediococcus cellicola]